VSFMSLPGRICTLAVSESMPVEIAAMLEPSRRAHAQLSVVQRGPQLVVDDQRRVEVAAGPPQRQRHRHARPRPQLEAVHVVRPARKVLLDIRRPADAAKRQGRPAAPRLARPQRHRRLSGLTRGAAGRAACLTPGRRPRAPRAARGVRCPRCPRCPRRAPRRARRDRRLLRAALGRVAVRRYLGRRAARGGARSHRAAVAGEEQRGRDHEPWARGDVGVAMGLFHGGARERSSCRTPRYARQAPIPTHTPPPARFAVPEAINPGGARDCATSHAFLAPDPDTISAQDPAYLPAPTSPRARNASASCERRRCVHRSEMPATSRPRARASRRVQTNTA
jgi:hypothetical protein